MTISSVLTYGIEHALLAGQPVPVDVRESITAASYEASFDQASTVTLTLSDPEGVFLTSPALASTITPGQLVANLAQRLTLQLGPDYYTLVKISKSGPSLTLTFEDQVVNALRQITGWVVKGQRSKMSRAGFCRRLALDPLAQRYLTGPGRIGFWAPEFASNRPPDPKTGKRPPPGQPTVAANDAKSSQRPPKTGGSQQDWAAGLTVTDAGGTVVKLTRNMKDNAAICIATALGMRPKPALVVLVSMLETIITEPIPPLTNTIGGDAKSTGLYQQQIGPGFSWHGGNNREEATREYVAAAMKIHAKYPTLPPGEIAWRVQNPAAQYRSRYARHESEAEALLTAYDKWVLSGAGGLTAPPGGWPAPPGSAPSSSKSPGGQTKKSSQSQGNEFSRSATETSWDAIKRLAEAVQWRAYASGRVIMFAPDTNLLESPSSAVYAERPHPSEVTKGLVLVDWIDFDLDAGKTATTATITLSPDQIPAGLSVGSVVLLQGVGPASSSFLVSDVQLDFWSATATLQVTAPRTPIPESKAPDGPSKTTSRTSKSAGQTAVLFAENFLGKDYHSGGGHTPNGIPAMIAYGNAQLTLYTTGFDCSGLVRCAWAQAHVDVGGVTWDQVSRAKSAGVPHGSGSPPPDGWKAGDLFFPVDTSQHLGHVVMMTGDGTKAIESPHTGDVIKYLDVEHDYGNKPDFWCRWQGAAV